MDLEDYLDKRLDTLVLRAVSFEHLVQGVFQTSADSLGGALAEHASGGEDVVLIGVDRLPLGLCYGLKSE